MTALRATRRLLLTVIAMLVLLCVSLVAGWANTWNHTRTFVAVADKAQANSHLCVNYAIVKVDEMSAEWDSIMAAIRGGGSVVLSSRKLLEDRNIAAPPEAGR